MCSSLKTCCCCTSLEVGTQIISFFNLLAPLAEIGYCVYMVVTSPLTEIKTTSIFVVLTVLAVFELFCACVFIYGTFNKQANFLLPWLVVAWVKAVAVFLLAVVWATVAFIAGWAKIDVAFAVLIAAFFVYPVILVYFACVGNSRRGEIQSECYSSYAPQRARSNSAIVRNVYVPMTKQYGSS